MRWCFATLAIIGLLGCGGSSGPARAQVSGKVTLGGKPLEGASVYFASSDGKFVGFGKTGADGTYRLAQGAVPGPNKIFISKIEGELPAGFDDNPESGMDRGQLEAMNMAATPGKGAANMPKEIVPADFATYEKTKLTFDVQAGANTDVNFDL